MILPADLRLRLVATFLLVLAVSQLGTIATAAAALAAAVVLALATGIGSGGWRRLLHVEGFVLLLLLGLPFTVAGAPVLEIGPFAASAEGVRRAALLACKAAAAVLVIMALLGRVEPERIGAALRGLRVPEPLVRLFSLTARYVGVIRDEGRRLGEAMRARAFRPGTSRHCWRSYGNLIGMLLVRALERAERVEEAMLCRGYQGRFPYASLPRPAAGDWIGFAALAGLSATLILLDRL